MTRNLFISSFVSAHLCATPKWPWLMFRNYIILGEMQIKQGDSKAVAAPAIIKNTRHYAKCYHPLYGTSGAGSGAHSVQFVRVVGREGCHIVCLVDNQII